MWLEKFFKKGDSNEIASLKNEIKHLQSKHKTAQLEYEEEHTRNLKLETLNLNLQKEINGLKRDHQNLLDKTVKLLDLNKNLSDKVNKIDTYTENFHISVKVLFESVKDLTISRNSLIPMIKKSLHSAFLKGVNSVKVNKTDEKDGAETHPDLSSISMPSYTSYGKSSMFTGHSHNIADKLSGTIPKSNLHKWNGVDNDDELPF